MKKFDRFTPEFDYILVDLNKIKDSKFVGCLEFVAGMRTLKHSSKGLDKAFNSIMALVKDHLTKNPLTNGLREFLRNLALYIIRSPKITRKHINIMLETVNDKKFEEETMSLLATLKEEGKEEGITIGKKEGITIGKKESAKNMKEDGVNIETIAKYTGLSIEEIKNL